uniref:Uncharacterized protein n=1 Tax=Nelumbo nucifera TaxID=4432 RepID=A0A822ZA74_NELNU|nr:TPA_asm: hypothetical protein HUJ06_001414 [Nelumbo nucifera]
MRTFEYKWFSKLLLKQRCNWCEALTQDPSKASMAPVSRKTEANE